MKLKTLTTYLEKIAPLSLQEAYDNSGLLIGDINKDISKVLITLDVTKEVIIEATENSCNVIIAHHPLIFTGLKRITGSDSVQKVVIEAIKKDIAIYAIHTNLDNVSTGVNKRLALKLNLQNYKTLVPKKGNLKKIVCFCPDNHVKTVRNAMFAAGAGYIGNYSNCSFNAKGTGTFKAGENTNPYAGERNKLHIELETRIEIIVPETFVSGVVGAMLQVHPYEEVAYDIYPLENEFGGTGSGMIGETEEETEIMDFLLYVKKILEVQFVRHSRLINRKVKKVAVCGGSCSFLIEKAFRAGADVLITADIKYHDFFLHQGEMTIVDAGHFETEQFTRELLYDILKEKFPTFALQISKVNTNAVSYL